MPEHINCYECEQPTQPDDLCQNPMSPDNEDRRVCIDCECECYSYCADCGVADYNDNMRWSEYYEETYCQDCFPSGAGDVDLEAYENTSEASFVSYGDNTFEENKFSRFVGVEIETIFPCDGFSGSDIPDFYPSTFRHTYDGSIETNNGRGTEFISEPMNGDILFKNIDRMCEYLQSCDYYINRTCGFHVHIDARDLYYRELRGIMLVVKSFESTLKNMMPNSRQESNWCKSLNANKYDIRNISSDTEFIMSWYDWANEPPSMDKYNSSRYYGLNLHARVYHGTIEFRYHSATNNRVKMKNWITICQSIVEQGIKLGREIDDIPVQSEVEDEKFRDFLYNNRDLGVEKFIKYLELEDIESYILKRVSKFCLNKRNTLSGKDIEYIHSNI